MECYVFVYMVDGVWSESQPAVYVYMNKYVKGICEVFVWSMQQDETRRSKIEASVER